MVISGFLSRVIDGNAKHLFAKGLVPSKCLHATSVRFGTFANHALTQFFQDTPDRFIAPSVYARLMVKQDIEDRLRNPGGYASLAFLPSNFASFALFLAQHEGEVACLYRDPYTCMKHFEDAEAKFFADQTDQLPSVKPDYSKVYQSVFGLFGSDKDKTSFEIVQACLDRCKEEVLIDIDFEPLTVLVHEVEDQQVKRTNNAVAVKRSDTLYASIQYSLLENNAQEGWSMEWFLTTVLELVYDSGPARLLFRLECLNGALYFPRVNFLNGLVDYNEVLKRETARQVKQILKKTEKTNQDWRKKVSVFLIQNRVKRIQKWWTRLYYTKRIQKLEQSLAAIAIQRAFRHAKVRRYQEHLDAFKRCEFSASLIQMAWRQWGAPRLVRQRRVRAALVIQAAWKARLLRRGVKRAAALARAYFKDPPVKSKRYQRRPIHLETKNNKIDYVAAKLQFFLVDQDVVTDPYLMSCMQYNYTLSPNSVLYLNSIRSALFNEPDPYAILYEAVRRVPGVYYDVFGNIGNYLWPFELSKYQYLQLLGFAGRK